MLEIIAFSDELERTKQFLVMRVHKHGAFILSELKGLRSINPALFHTGGGPKFLTR